MSNMNRSLLSVSWNTLKLLRTSMKSGWMWARLASSQCDVPMVVPKEEVVRFVSECMCKAGTSLEDGCIVGHHLMVADYRGHFSHGMNRMQMYVQDIKDGMTNPTAKPEILTDFQAIALVNGNNGLGQVIGKFCMELVIKKAKKFGIGMVSTCGSNHYGICGYYTKMAIDQGLVGFSCTNTSPLMAPTRSKCAGLGTNPISLGMGASNNDEFVLDMATTAVALGKIELAIRKNEAIPSGWALGSDGKVTTNAEEAYKTSLLLPVGGEEHTSGYKGYGLALMVEVLCGILSGSEFGPNIRQWKTKEKIANLGQCFMAINPEAFGCGSKERLGQLLKQLRNLAPAEDKPVLIPGDLERAAMKRVDKEGGITYHPNQIQACKEFAKVMGVEPLKLIPKNG
ncbi:uncharacterized oxidoreductase YjmC-like [Bombus bifarius]|uniref:Uncharacterized oxidoreductase YjmC-like n=1 Tax=Bombus bifarius TaxID=103933 RepID=A0A6P8LEU3_9HYME|nr:uncharacterized oxidoreductase YjmC-like [Bombus bifarius]XP_033298726.1 uncharacterized oxidoreductase YjmC-like [Bombus bifarius]